MAVNSESQKFKRIPISPKLRFEVFKRDKFTCQYCGAKAPDVVLEADHIEPVAAGGTSDILNLITSCKGCNGGKGARLLVDGDVLDKQRDMLAELEERRQQIDMILQWRGELENIEKDTIEIVETRIFRKTGCVLNDSGRRDVRKWLKKFTFDLILRAIDESFDTYGLYVKDEMTDASFNKAFNKIPGVIGILQQENERPHLRRLLYIQGILRRRTDDYTLNCIDFLQTLVDAGFDVDEMERRAKRVDDIADFDMPYFAALAKQRKS